jgi:protein-S-isoprenylcysteine O-methyltransferase Ste14
MGRLIAFLYGVACYAACVTTLLYAIGFVSGIAVPKTIDGGSVVPITDALGVDLLLMVLFAVQHSAMARRSFKRWLTRLVPAAIERSTYVLMASLVLAFLFWQWRPIPTPVWQIENAGLATAITALSHLGWLIVFSSTFLINHFELFGLHQVVSNLLGRRMPAPRFRTPFFYKLVRHPLYMGLIIAFWAAPSMTAGRLLFASVATLYIIMGALLEERDLVELFGDEYRRYRERVSMLVPWRRSA